MTSPKGKIKICAEFSLFSFWGISGLHGICVRQLAYKWILHSERDHDQQLLDVSQTHFLVFVFVPDGHMDVLVHRQVKAEIFFISLTLAIRLIFIVGRKSWSLANVPKNSIRQPIMLPSKRRDDKSCGNVLSDSQGHHFWRHLPLIRGEKSEDQDFWPLTFVSQ